MAFALNTKNIIDSNKIPAVVKLCAIELDKKTYFSMSYILDKISDLDLETLQYCAESKLDVDTESFAIFSMICLTAEGSGDIEEETIFEHMNKCAVMINLEGLRRKGLIEFDSTQLSFSDLHKLVANPTDRGREVAKQLQKGSDTGSA